MASDVLTLWCSTGCGSSEPATTLLQRRPTVVAGSVESGTACLPRTPNKAPCLGSLSQLHRASEQVTLVAQVELSYNKTSHDLSRPDEMEPQQATATTPLDLLATQKMASNHNPQKAKCTCRSVTGDIRELFVVSYLHTSHESKRV